MILSLQQGLKEHGFTVSLIKLCQWFEGAKATVYYSATRAEPRLQEHFDKPFKAIIEGNPTFGCRSGTHLLDFNKNTVLRVFQLMGCQVRMRLVRFRPHIQAFPSLATAPDERWATELSRVWAVIGDWIGFYYHQRPHQAMNIRTTAEAYASAA